MNDKAEPISRKRKLGDSHRSNNGIPAVPNEQARISHTGPSTTRHLGRKGLQSGAYQSHASNSRLIDQEIEELLTQVRLPYDRLSGVERVLRKLESVIKGIPEQDPLSISDAIKLRASSGIRIPFPGPWPDEDAKYKLAYLKPSYVSVIGSYARKSAVNVRAGVVVDLAIAMPSELFQEKDYLNFRYFHKRAFYLSCVVAGITQDSSCTFNLEYTYQNDSSLQPAIFVHSGLDGGDDDFRRTKCGIRIILVSAVTLFPPGRTLPDKNCVRIKDAEGEPIALQHPTPFYNATLRSECTSLAYLKFLHTASAIADAFRDACLLGSIWLRQRGFGTGLSGGGFGPFEWACTMALLLQGGGHNARPVLSKEYSSYQMFKATLQYLAVTDMVQTPVIVLSDISDVRRHGGPVLFDGATQLNVLYKMSPWSYLALRQDAEITIKMLTNPLEPQFEACFITKTNRPIQRYDQVVRMRFHSLRGASESDASEEIDTMCLTLYRALERGLGDRVQLIDIKRAAMQSHPTDTTTDQMPQNREIVVGIFLAPEKVYRTLDKGPSAQEKDAAADFRRFWGDKAELRRFRDGTILESLVWSTSNPDQSIFTQLCAHILHRHFRNTVSIEETVGDQFTLLLPHQGQSRHDHELTAFKPLNEAFDNLEKQIRNLEGLPLQIRHIFPADTQLRYTSSRLPLLSLPGRQMYPANIHVQFEGSNRWPDDFAAVQKTKIAFLLKLGELLGELDSTIETRLGREDFTCLPANLVFLDIKCASGAAFRLRIHHERETFLLERDLKMSLRSTVEAEKAAAALSIYKRDFVQVPMHTQAVRTLCTRFTFLSPTIRLLKKWRDCHLLSNHIGDELLELFAIRAFVHPGSYSIPGSTMAGFVRTLVFLARWDWRNDPLILDVGGEMSTPEIDSIRTRFEACRKIDPAMNKLAMFVASSIDRDGTTWTEMGPSKVVAARFTSLVRAAVDLVKGKDIGLRAADLFTPILADYDFIIHLNANTSRLRLGRVYKQTGFKNLQLADPTLIGLGPSDQLLLDLRQLHGQSVVYFHNAEEGKIIGGLWNPLTESSLWKINPGFSTRPAQKETQDADRIEVNRTGILNDIARLGGDIVRSIEQRL